MVGILLASHYTLGECLKDTASHIVGERDNVLALALNRSDKAEHFAEKIKEAVAKLEKGDGVIIFTDMFGGTPCNAAMSLYLNDESVRIITGFNLPLVIEAIMHSDKPIDELVKSLMDKRDKTIVDAKALFRKR